MDEVTREGTDGGWKKIRPEVHVVRKGGWERSGTSYRGAFKSRDGGSATEVRRVLGYTFIITTRPQLFKGRITLSAG